MVDYKDNGFKSRKMIMTYVVLLLGTVGFIITGYWPALAVTFPEYCMFLIGASGVYIGGNAAIKWVAARSQRPTSVPEETSR